MIRAFLAGLAAGLTWAWLRSAQRSQPARLFTYTWTPTGIERSATYTH